MGKRSNLGLQLVAEELECFQLQGSSSPPDQGLCPWTPLGAMSQDPLAEFRHLSNPQILLSPLGITASCTKSGNNYSRLKAK